MSQSRQHLHLAGSVGQEYGGGGVNNKVHVYRVTSGYEGATHGHLHRRVEDGDAVAISDAAMEAFQLPLLAVTCSNCRARMR